MFWHFFNAFSTKEKRKKNKTKLYKHIRNSCALGSAGGDLSKHKLTKLISATCERDDYHNLYAKNCYFVRANIDFLLHVYTDPETISANDMLTIVQLNMPSNRTTWNSHFSFERSPNILQSRTYTKITQFNERQSWKQTLNYFY